MTSANTDPAVDQVPRRRRRPPTTTEPRATAPEPRATAPEPRATTTEPRATAPAGQTGPAGQKRPRQRNPRGQGERLRDDIIEAASRLLADPAAPPLTLRAVAREAGVATTSVYLHFDDIQSLIVAVAERRFGELVQLQDDARSRGADPCQRVRAGCLAYCEFGLTYQGHYQVMFANPLPMPADMTPEQFPGWKAFQQLIEAVADCIGVDTGDRQAFFTAQLIWQQLHGIVSLRISRPRFPWPPLAETVNQAVDRLLADAQATRPEASVLFLRTVRGVTVRSQSARGARRDARGHPASPVTNRGEPRPASVACPRASPAPAPPGGPGPPPRARR